MNLKFVQYFDNERSSKVGLLNVVGNCGPGVQDTHLRGLQALADLSGEALVILGSRQTGFSAITGQAYASDADLDVGVVGDSATLNKVIDSVYKQVFKAERSSLIGLNWQRIIPDVKHPPIYLFDSIEQALDRGLLVIRPRQPGY